MKTPAEKHPDPQQIERFVRGEASGAENRALVRHLVHGCPQCQRLARNCWTHAQVLPFLDVGSRRIDS